MSTRQKILLISILFLIGCAPRHNYYIKTVVAPKNTITNIAVIPENWDTYWISSFTYRSLITELMDVGFTVIERSNLVSIIDEQKLQHSGLVKDENGETKSFETRTLDRTTIAKLGEVLGVEKLLLIYVVPSGRKLNMATIRLVDVETAIILTSTTVITPDAGVDADVIMKQVALDIADAVNDEKRIIRDKLFGATGSQQGPSINLREKGDKIIDEK